MKKMTTVFLNTVALACIFACAPIAASANATDDCEADFSAGNYGGASVSCMYSYEDQYKAAMHEKGQRHDEYLLLAANDLAFAGISNIRSQLDTEKGKMQLDRARTLTRMVLNSKYVATDAHELLLSIDKWILSEPE